jgi:four helix bundle protein
MSTQTFRDLIVWQKAQDLVVDVYKSFSEIKDYSFKDQIQRAAVSIPNNIAEGYARRSNKAFANFLMIAKGSAVELESMLDLAEKLGYINNSSKETLSDQAQQTIKLLTAFKNKLDSK